MTINEAIQKIDEMKPNTYKVSDKIKWLSILDGMVKRLIIDTHKDGEDIVFSTYDDNTPLTKELLVPEPHDEMYVAWLESKMDYYNGEYTKYNNSVTHFNELYSAYENDYNRHHMPLGKKIRYW